MLVLNVSGEDMTLIILEDIIENIPVQFFLNRRLNIEGMDQEIRREEKGRKILPATETYSSLLVCFWSEGPVV